MSDGAEGDDFIFNIIPLSEVTKDYDNEGAYLEFAEYMIYSESCFLEINPSNKNYYRFFIHRANQNNRKSIRKYVANSILEFIALYLKEGTFGIWVD